MTDPQTIAGVVLSYNYDSYVLSALASLLDQTEHFDEVLVVDDGSTDGSQQLLAGRLAQAPGSFHLLHKTNGGQLSAALAALGASTADYVYFLDADDVADLRLVERVRPHLVQAPVKVQFPLVATDAGLTPTGSVFPQLRPQYGSEQMRQDNATLGFYVCPPTSGNVYLRSALLGLDLEALDQRDFIDGPATLALPYVGLVVSLDTPLAFYRIHGSNHSAWSRPSVEQLLGEVTWFRERWNQTTALVDRPAPPVVPDNSAYVLERLLMVAALQGSRQVPSLMLAFDRRVLRSHLPVLQRLSLVAWAGALALPSPRLRRRAVDARRSPGDRPWLLDKGVRIGRTPKVQRWRASLLERLGG